MIGFSGSPWTLATYMIEGGSSKAFKNQDDVYSEPQTLHMLLDKLADSVIEYLNLRLKLELNLSWCLIWGVSGSKRLAHYSHSNTWQKLLMD